MRMIRVGAATFRFGQTEIPRLREDSALAMRETHPFPGVLPPRDLPEPAGRADFFCE